MKKNTIMGIVFLLLVAIAAIGYSISNNNGAAEASRTATTSSQTNGPSLQGITLEDMNGQKVSLASLKGKPLLIKLWASWCPVCLDGLGELDALSADKNKGFEVISVVAPGKYREKSKEDFQEWYKGLSYKNINPYYDLDGTLMQIAKTNAYPTFILTNNNLEIQAIVPGHVPAEKIKAMFAEIAKKDGTNTSNGSDKKNTAATNDANKDATATISNGAGAKSSAAAPATKQHQS